jgi:predicted permease
VAAQLAIATVLVVTAGLLGRSLARLAEVDPGFETEGGVVFRVTAPTDAYTTDGDVVRFFQEVRRALVDVPGVEHAGFVSRLPMGSGLSRITVLPEGVEVVEGAKVPEADHRLVTPGFFEALGASLREGRTPTEADDVPGEVVVGVVNRTAAERFWPDGSAVGRHFLGRQGVLWLRVVGVVEDIREGGLDRPVDPAVYILHRDWPWRTLSAVVRSREPVSVDRLEAAVWSVHPSVPVTRVRTLDRVVAEGRQRVRVMAILATTLGAVALLLGSLGVYGVVSYAVGRRRAEFGVRVALGAGRASLERGELLRAGRLVALGILLGIPGAWVAGRALGSTLFGVTPLAPGVLVPVTAGLALVGLLAAWVPVHRAVRVDPVEALRAE